MAKANEKFTIKIPMGDKESEKRVFVGGCKGGDVWIERGKEVQVSREVLDRLDAAVELVPHVPNAEKPTEVEYIERPRFPYQLLAA